MVVHLGIVVTLMAFGVVVTMGMGLPPNSTSASFSDDMTLDPAMKAFGNSRSLLQAAAASSPGPALPITPGGHCQVTKGDWCGSYYQQEPLPAKPAPRGDKDCPNGCSNVGNCDYDTGTCWCPAGYGGPDCSAPRKRPCWRMGPDLRDLDWIKYPEWSHSRCAGMCDDNIAMCYCPNGTKYGRILAPPGSPIGTKPIQEGRPLYWCQPSSDEHNNPIKWGAVKYQDLFGPNGWCNSDLGTFQCPCRIDGVVGSLCNIKVEMYCQNQCSGHGHCDQGFCKCHPGWYGIDCSRKRKGLPIEPGDETIKPWLKDVVMPVVAAQDPPASPTRKRPFVYVYDTWPDYNTDILQYRIERSHCTYRTFNHGNKTGWVGYNAYAVEQVIIELMLTSEHRTFDPEEADYFFVPTMAGCLYDVYGWNPIPMWPKGYHGSRPFGSANMLRETYRWLSNKYPYFNRTGGQNHIWLMPHDEGACAAPKEIWPGIILSHWGRMDFPHTSNSQYHADNYTNNHQHADFPKGWGSYSWGTHPCFDPEKDLLIPCFKQPAHYGSSKYMGAQGGQSAGRDIFLFFRGDVGRTRDDPTCVYSRCIRQTIDKLAKQHDWRNRHNVWYGDRQDTPGEYGVLLSRSRFCLALPGDGWSARFEDAVLHGCIPVIIMDNTQVPFESILDMKSFTVRILQKDIPNIIDILKAIPKEQEEAMRAAVDKIWHRFRWSGLKMVDQESSNVVEHNVMSFHGGIAPKQEGFQYAKSRQDDAFSTLLQWLLWRVPHTRGKPRPNEKLYVPPGPQ